MEKKVRTKQGGVHKIRRAEIFSITKKGSRDSKLAVREDSCWAVPDRRRNSVFRAGPFWKRGFSSKRMMADEKDLRRGLGKYQEQKGDVHFAKWE